MINFLKGTIEDIGENQIILDVAGVGFELVCSSSATKSFKSAEKVKILTYLQVRDDALVLFGFKDRLEKDMFEKLLTVSGIGPKMAITILSGISVTDFAVAVLNANVKTLSSIKGLGKKTAERIIVELREKVSGMSNDSLEFLNNKQETLNAEIVDAVYALIALGINKTNATTLATDTYKQGMKAEDVIRECLKGMAK
ncbi:MAG: Holliday junction branch migration protein RuvA [Clostridia bacterium]